MRTQANGYPRTDSKSPNEHQKPFITKFLALFYFFFFHTFLLQGQSGQGAIKGRILAENDEALPGISIRLEGTTLGTTTRNNGSFELKNVAAGTYTLSVSGVGYTAQKQNITVRTNETTLLDYQLNSQTNELSEVTISSERRPAFATINKIAVPIRDMPLTTSSVSARTIEQRGVDDLGEAMKNTTGVRANNTYGGFQHFTVRGFNNFVLLVDGVRDERHNISTSAPSTNLANVERIEVLKGPASVLFGHSALGGIINIIRKQPTAEFKADFSAAYGSFNTRRMRAGAGGAINDKLRYRLDFGLSDTEGYRQFGVSTNNAYLALEYTPTAKDYFLLSIGANKDKYDTDSGIPMLPGSKIIPGLDIDTRYNDPADFLKNTRYDFQLKYVRQLSDKLRLSNQLSYYDDNIDYFSTESLTPNATLDSINRSYPFYFNHLTKPIQNQLELTADFNTGRVEQKVLVGYSLSVLDRRTYNGEIFGPGQFATVAVKNPILNQGYIDYRDVNYRATEETAHGIYVQDWLRFSEKLKALVGLRYDIFRGTYYTDLVDADRNVTQEGAKSTIARSALTYRLGLVYQPTQALSLYGSYSTYFKPSRRIAPNGETFDPETGYQAEIGSRLELSKRWSGNLSVYYMRKDNQVEALPGGVFKRIGSAESKGFEAEIQGNPLVGLDVTAGYTFTKAKYLPHANGEVNAAAGKKAVFAPENLLNIWLNYELQTTALKGLSLGVGANYMDQTFTNSANTYALPAYTVVDAALGYRVGRVGVRLNLNNALNERYFANAIFANQFTPGPTRNYLVTIRYSL
ncbi:TonB-dependent receptor [Tellurirhabdus bombi]|uniref:TonB-dependent receptor n=1 Tax=Tellurirhabdus bombi TaxID=2907205 RepID=UPI001F2A88A5|nr:TonB-dependent receptor [Tellurirhabdus bombi]